jgi:hypothetical protein
MRAPWGRRRSARAARAPAPAACVAAPAPPAAVAGMTHRVRKRATPRNLRDQRGRAGRRTTRPTKIAPRTRHTSARSWPAAGAMPTQQPSRGRKLRRLLIPLLLVSLCVWALPLARGGVFDGDCASVAGDDAAWLGLGGRRQAPAWGALRRGSGGGSAGGVGGDSVANARGSLCASAAALAARPPPRPLAATLGVVTRLCATLEAPADQVRLWVPLPRRLRGTATPRRVTPPRSRPRPRRTGVR